MSVIISMPEGVAQEVEEQMVAMGYEVVGVGCGSTEFSHAAVSVQGAEMHVNEILNKLKSRIVVMRDENE